MGLFSSSKNDPDIALIQQAERDMQEWRATGQCPRCGLTNPSEGRWAHLRWH